MCCGAQEIFILHKSKPQTDELKPAIVGPGTTAKTYDGWSLLKSEVMYHWRDRIMSATLWLMHEVDEQA